MIKMGPVEVVISSNTVSLHFYSKKDKNTKKCFYVISNMLKTPVSYDLKYSYYHMKNFKN